ncbi:translation factor GUF1 mitochondrial [Fusarium acuminatum]|uniref:Translation factor GUF1 mitochondrial n=1 Tax=Fusarium acuminatum TaxID=5515 RepID=A0ABZ2WRH5_9HYPO
MSLAWSVGRAWSRQCLSQATARPSWHIRRPRTSLCSTTFTPTLLTSLRAYATSNNKPTPAQLEARIAAIPIERYRNFCIVAHIDHGKSTLSDRLLEYTGTISASDANKQILDKLDVERERGITVKAQTCTMIHKYKGEDYLLHLVDTPGHVDFRAEVTRSLFDGTIKAGDNVISMGTGMKYTVGQVGIQYPHAIPQPTLSAGQVGYVYFNPGMKKIQDAKLGDTFTFVGSEDKVEPYPGFEEPKPMVFVAAFPTDQSDYSRLADSIGQLVLNDRSVTLQKDHSEALGAGWRLGFLGSLHCSVFQDRLRQEHGRSVILTEPTVPSKIIWPDGSEEVVSNPALFPDTSNPKVKQSMLFEPYVTATVTMPEEYLGRVIELCEANRGEQKSLEFFHTTQVILRYEIPTAQLVDDLFGKLKSVTKGYATLDYEDAGWKQSHLSKLQLLVNRQPVDAICKVVHSSQVDRLGKQWVTKFKEHVDRQHFEVVIQATAGNRIVARETIKPFRKDVLAKLHAADVSRRRKLLEKQKEGRKRLRAVGNVIIDQSAFQSFMSR